VFHCQRYNIGDSYVEVNSSTDGRNRNVSIGTVVKRRRYSVTLYVYCLFCCHLPLSWITVVVCSSLRYSSVHRRNLANKIFEWGGGTKSIIGVRNFHLGRSERGKRPKIGLNQSFIYIHTPLSPILIQIILFCRLQPSSKKNLFLCIKNVGGGFTLLPSLPQFTSMPGPTDTCASNMFIF